MTDGSPEPFISKNMPGAWVWFEDQFLVEFTSDEIRKLTRKTLSSYH